jgi:radical SAM protein with 4Fe4S-binding SPASM domain
MDPHFRTKKRYQKVNIEISNICNLQCSFCPEVVRTKRLMDLELFRSIIEQVAPLTEQVCFHLMGDPLVHPHLEKLVAICTEFGVPIFFVTNGVLLNERNAELLLESPFRQVNFSLHSFHDNFKDRDPSTYLARIFDYTERAFQARPDLYINFRLWNLGDVRGSRIENRKMLARIESRFNFQAPEVIDVRVQKSVRIRNRLYLHFDTEFVWPSMDLPVLGTSGTCYGLRSHFGILVDGTVVPCCLDKEGAIALGNIRTESLEVILQSPRATRMLEGFRARRLVEGLCQKCQYIERFQPKTPEISH